MLGFLVRRVLLAVLVLAAAAVVDYGLVRALNPRIFPGEEGWAGTWAALEGIVTRFDLGNACSHPGCPPIAQLFGSGWAVDLQLLLGALTIGLVGGVLLGAWCAARSSAWPGRIVESGATLLFCAPIYVVAMLGLLAFEPSFGLWNVPVLSSFFFPGSHQPLTSDPWTWLQSMLVPTLLLAAPVGAVVLRLTVAAIREQGDAHHLRTAFAKGLRRGTVFRRHATPATLPGTVSLVGASVPWFVVNLILIETVFSTPGFVFHTRRAATLGESPVGSIDLPLLQAIALWMSVLIIVLSLLTDLVVERLDPRRRV